MESEMAVTEMQPCFYSDITAVLKQLRDVKVASDNMYDTLLRTLSDSDCEIGLLIKIFGDLEQCVSMLNKEYQPVIGIIMKMKWMDKGPELTAAYQSFILNLVSAHMIYLKPCLRMLVTKFIADDSNLEVSGNSDGVCKKRAENFSHIHSLLKSLTQMVPMSSIVLVQILESLFPYINRSVLHFEQYTQNLLLVTTYMPAQRMDILNLVVKNMLKLDVRSSRLDISVLISSNEEDDSDTENAIFEMDETLEAKPQSPQEDPAGDRLATALPQAGSLDAMMVLIFQYIRDQCYIDGKLDWDITKRLYRELLSVFDKYIFPTHDLCHVQYIMFYICSFKEPLADGFIDYLWKKVTDPTAQIVYRQCAACYIGSFLTRAGYLSIQTAKEVVELMVKWIHAYLDQICEQGLRADLAHHAPFYSMCQSAFYIFCFKHNDFMEMKRGQKWAESLNFQRIITNKLNPLRVCVPIIVSTFASAARLHQLAFCDTIIERNNRYCLPVTSTNSTAVNTRQKHLESYFPFDPYLLPRSCSYIKQLYKEFRGNLPGETDNDDEDEDDFLPSEDDEDINQSANQASMSLGRSPVDVLKYGVSPGFKDW